MSNNKNKVAEMAAWIDQAWFSVRDDWWCNGCAIGERTEEELLEEFEETFGEVPKSDVVKALEAADYVASRYLWSVLCNE